MSKHDKVKQYLLGGKSITGLTALKLFGLYRLSHVIYMLRKEGHKIKTEPVTKNGATFARYILELPEK